MRLPAFPAMFVATLFGVVLPAAPAASPTPADKALITTTAGAPSEAQRAEKELERMRAAELEMMRAAEEERARYEEAERRSASQQMSREPGAHEELSWAVEPFAEKDGWRAEHPALAGSPWGDVLAARVTEQLEARNLPTRLLLTKLTDAELRRILEKTGLRFLVEGRIESLKASGKSAKREVELAVTFQLRRKIGDSLRTVQKRTVKVRAPAPGAVSAATFEELAIAAAAKIADRLAEDIPKDVLAERG